MDYFGGCRCQAFMLTGDASNADPVCSKSPHHGVILAARAEAEHESPSVWVGELYLEAHRGTFTSVAAVKAGNRRSEHLLREAELWCATAAVRGLMEYPLARFGELWRQVCLYQFHDILPGSSIREVYEDAAAELGEGSLALLAALVVVQSVTGDAGAIVVDARLAAAGLAIVLLLLRVNFLVIVLAAGALAAFFGGTALDGLAAGLFALVLCVLQIVLPPLCKNKVLFNFLSAFAVGGLICLACRLVPALHSDKVIIGDIMLLIPGIMLTNSIRDILLGDIISGSLRLVEAILMAATLALGMMAAIWLMGGISA